VATAGRLHEIGICGLLNGPAFRKFIAAPNGCGNQLHFWELRTVQK
jgi:hypothetical protein